jgi:mRNA interferase YafQ
MLTPIPKKSFQKDVRLLKRRHYDMTLLKHITELLAAEEPLPPEAHPHWLSGNWANHMECHIKGDWVIVYVPDLENRTITFYRTGSHADLFD